MSRSHPRPQGDFEDLLGAIYLYVDWRYVSKQLTTEQKELWADSIEAWSARMNDDEPPMEVPRWWRPDYPLREVDDLRRQLEDVVLTEDYMPRRLRLGVELLKELSALKQQAPEDGPVYPAIEALRKDVGVKVFDLKDLNDP